MSRWNNYVERIDEKVSKKEINTALKNDNILIGCEFEFKLDQGLSAYGSSEIAELYERAVDEADEYEKDRQQYEMDRSEYEGETQELRDGIETMDERIDELTDAIETQNDEENPELEEKISEAENEKDEAESELDTHEADKDVWVEEGNLDDWEAVKRELNTRISNAKVDIYRHTKSLEKNGVTEEEWQAEIDKLERNKSSDEDDIKYREEEGIYEQLSEPYVSEQSMSNYWEYMTDYMGFGENDLYTEGGEELNHYPQDLSEGGEVEDLEQAVEDSGILKDAPFDDYEIGSYGAVSQEVGSRDWAIEDDSSLGPEGLEVKNPPMELPEFMKDYLDDMFDWIGKHGYTDSDCGFHCHMSVKNPEKEIDFLKLILFTDEGWIYNAFSDRANNTFANSVKDKLQKGATIDPKKVIKLFNKKQLILKINMSSQHFDAINNIDDKGHVEFRYMGGSDYHRKLKDVTAMIGIYAHNLSLAMDPEFKKKEYILKLQRIFNKMEMYELEMKLIAVREVKKRILKDGGYLEQQDIPKLDLILKVDGVKYKKLASIYKLDGKTKTSIKSNKMYMQGMGERVVKELSSIGAGFIRQEIVSITNSWTY